jgi:SNARE protein 1
MAMAQQQGLQEGLTDEMAELASSIKNNSLAMEASLKESRRELDAAEGDLARNLGGVRP